MCIRDSYTTSGDYNFTIANGACTDTVILHLTIGQPETGEFSASGCDNYTLPWGTVVTASGDYTNVYQTALGCDSTVTAHITIGTGGHTDTTVAVSYTHLRAHETGRNLVCRLLLEKKKKRQ